MKIITHEDIIKLNISPKTCLEWVEDMLKNREKSQNPPKIHLRPYDGVFCNVMPCIVDMQDLSRGMGLKVVTRFPNQVPSVDSKLILLDAKSGAYLAVMDANWITTMRTGMIAAHSANLFGKKDFKTISIMGLGNTGRATMLGLAEIIKNRNITVKLLKYKGQEELFKERFSYLKNFKFEFVNSYIEAIENTDIVLSAVTYFKDDICPDKYFKEGITVIPIHTRGFTNCDLFFDKVFVADIPPARDFKNFDKFKKLGVTNDVVNGLIPGRENDSERILVYNMGLAINDVNFANQIYNMLDKSKLQEIDFKAPKEKFYI